MEKQWLNNFRVTRIIFYILLILLWFRITNYNNSILNKIIIFIIFAIIFPLITQLPFLVGEIPALHWNHVTQIKVAAHYGWSLIIYESTFLLFKFDLQGSLATFLGIASALVGMLLFYVPQNPILGVRIPLTSHNSHIWDRVNYLNAWLFVAVGVPTIIFGNLYPDYLGVIFISLIIVVLFTVITYAKYLATNGPR